MSPFLNFFSLSREVEQIFEKCQQAMTVPLLRECKFGIVDHGPLPCGIWVFALRMKGGRRWVGHLADTGS